MGDDPATSVVQPDVHTVEFYSHAVGRKMKYNIVLPPDYEIDVDASYQVLYLLHGIGGDETEWQRFAAPDRLFDNLTPEYAITYLDQHGHDPRFPVDDNWQNLVRELVEQLVVLQEPVRDLVDVRRPVAWIEHGPCALRVGD